jgi:hypothetical protein
MTPKKLWVISLILLAVHLAIQYIFFQNFSLINRSGILHFGINLFTNLAIVFTIGAVLGTVLAFIPFRQKFFGEKFKTTFPLFTSIVLLFLVFTFAYLTYLKKVKGIQLGPLQKYEDIDIPANLDCSLVHKGKFETEKLLIERTENRQTQTNKKNGVKKIFTVNWINDCEYILTSVSDNSEKLSIKIIRINSDTYSCYVISNKAKYPNFLIIKRIK